MQTKAGHVEIRGVSGLDCIKVNHTCEDEAATFAAWIRVMTCTDNDVILALEDTGVQILLWCPDDQHLQYVQSTQG